MASKYDIQAIQFLIASFNSIVKEVGKTDSSVRLFKRQSDGLCSLGKVSKNDVEFVYRLLGMKNTNSLKWEISLNRLKNLYRSYELYDLLQRRFFQVRMLRIADEQ